MLLTTIDDCGPAVALATRDRRCVIFPVTNMTIEATAPITIVVRKVQIAMKYAADAVSSDRPTAVSSLVDVHRSGDARRVRAGSSMFGGPAFLRKSKNASNVCRRTNECMCRNTHRRRNEPCHKPDNF